MRKWTRLGMLAVVMLDAPARAQSGLQQVPPVASQEALMLAQGWGYLSNGDAAHAAMIAGQLLAQFPLSEAGVALAIEAELPRSGWIGALGVYEQWLGARRLDSGYALRRVARACLRDSLQNVAARSRALEALIADGDQDAITQATAASKQGKFADTRALAATGSDEAVKALIAQLDAVPNGRGPIIDALGMTHNALAVPPLVRLLDDPKTVDVDKAQAAAALGNLGQRSVVSKLQPLLGESRPYPVRFSAAKALGQLGDFSGVAFLREAMMPTANPQGGSYLRMQAAAALASIGPDTGWVDTARSLLNDSDANVRAEAARMIAPFDNAAARGTLDVLLNDVNPAIRQKAAQILAQSVAGDFATLRGLLRAADVETRVDSAARILEIVR
jgi:HEAT repeat protein